MRSTLLLLLSLIVVIFADFNFQGNVTLNDPNPFKYRDFTYTQLNVGGVAGTFFESVSTVNGTNQQDVVVGALFVVSTEEPPTSFVSFFTSYSNWLNLKIAAASPLLISFQTTDTLVAKTFLSLEEVNTTNNATVRTINLVNLNWALLQPNNPATPTTYLAYSTIQGTSAAVAANFSVSITAVFSQILGLLNVVGTPILTPKSLETLVTISNYPYANRANALRLNLVIGTGQVNVSVQGSAVLTSGNGTTANYVRISNQCQADGNVGTATVTVQGQQATSTGNAQIDSQLTARYSNQKTFTQVSVQFPAGAAQIVFDPTVGAGTDPNMAGAIIATGATTTSKTGSASQFGPIFALIFLIAALVF